MARGYYLNGTPTAFGNKKSKHGRFNIDGDMNSLQWIYNAKNISGLNGENREETGGTLDAILTFIRSTGVTELDVNLVKSPTLHPAGRLRTINTGGIDAPIMEIQDAGTQFAVSGTYTYVTKENFSKIGGLDILAFSAPNELTPIGEDANDYEFLGFYDFDNTAVYQYNIRLNNSKTLAFNATDGLWYIIEDVSESSSLIQPPLTTDAVVINSGAMPNNPIDIDITDDGFVYILQEVSNNETIQEVKIVRIEFDSATNVASNIIESEIITFTDITTESIETNLKYLNDKIVVWKDSNIWIYEYNSDNDTIDYFLDKTITFNREDGGGEDQFLLGWGLEKTDNSFVFSNRLLRYNDEIQINSVNDIDLDEKDVVSDIVETRYNVINWEDFLISVKTLKINTNTQINQGESSVEQDNITEINTEDIQEGSGGSPLITLFEVVSDEITDTYSRVGIHKAFGFECTIRKTCTEEQVLTFTNLSQIKIWREGNEIVIEQKVQVAKSEEVKTCDPRNPEGAESFCRYEDPITYISFGSTRLDLQKTDNEHFEKSVPLILIDESLNFERGIETGVRTLFTGATKNSAGQPIFYGVGNMVSLDKSDSSILVFKGLFLDSVDKIFSPIFDTTTPSGDIYLGGGNRDINTLDVSEDNTLNNYIIDSYSLTTKENTIVQYLDEDYVVGSENRANINNKGKIFVTGVSNVNETEEGDVVYVTNEFLEDEQQTIAKPPNPNASFVRDQPIFLPSNIKEVPQADGKAQYFEVTAQRIDIPRIVNADGKFVKMNFILDEPSQPINAKFLKISYETFALHNKIEVFGAGDEVIGTKLDVNSEENYLLWPLISSPIVSGTTIYWDFPQISEDRFLEEFYDAMMINGAEEIDWNTSAIGDSMIPNIKYAVKTNGNPWYNISQAFLSQMFSSTPGSTDLDNASNGYGLSNGDLTYSRLLFTEGTPLRRWNFTDAYRQQDFFIRKVYAGVENLYFAKGRVNEKLEEVDEEFRGSENEEFDREFKLSIMDGMLRTNGYWNSTLFDQDFASNNGGSLSTITKNNDIRKWSKNNIPDKSYGLVSPASLKDIEEAMKRASDIHGAQTISTIRKKSIKWNDNPFFPRKILMPIAEDLYSRLPQQVFTDPDYAESIGLPTNWTEVIELDKETKIDRIRWNVMGGKTITVEFLDEFGNVSIDSDGTETKPIVMQAPNLQQAPNDTVLDKIMGFTS